jgi:hypothetical protein
MAGSASDAQDEAMPLAIGPNAMMGERPCPAIRAIRKSRRSSSKVKKKNRTVDRPLSYSKKRAAWLLFVYYYIVKTESLRDLRFWALWAPTEGIGEASGGLGPHGFFGGQNTQKKVGRAARGAFGSRVSGLGSRVPVLMDQVQR